MAANCEGACPEADCSFFFLKNTAPPEISPLPLPAPLPFFRPAAGRGVRVDAGPPPRHGKLLEARQRVAAVQHEFAAAAQLHRAAVDHVDAGDDHRRTRMPRSDNSSLMPPTVSSPSWNTDAASTASAPAENACATWSRLPMPPEAITGTRTVRTTARNSSKSGPALVPSRSQLVSRISPAPSPAPSRAHST